MRLLLTTVTLFLFAACGFQSSDPITKTIRLKHIEATQASVILSEHLPEAFRAEIVEPDSLKLSTTPEGHQLAAEILEKADQANTNY